MITYDKKGGRAVELFLPFEHDGKKVDTITFLPIRFDHVLRWQKGEWKSMLGLMAVVANTDEAMLRNLAYPDTDRVIAVFVDMLPPEIRNTLETESATEQPQPSQLSAANQPLPFATNGSGPDLDNPMAEKFKMDLPSDGLTQEEKDSLGLGVELER